MALTTNELHWISKRMDWYGIKFQEIYDEIADHIITAVEKERSAGDQRTIDLVFDTVTEREFGGYLGVDKIVKVYERAYRHKIRKELRTNFKSQLNFQTVLCVCLLVTIGIYLPQNKPTTIVMWVGLVATAFIPIIFASRNAPQIKTDDGKQSIVKSYMTTRACGLLFLLSSLLNTFNFVGEQWSIEFIRPQNYPPAVCMVLLSFFVIYGLTTIEVCKQEFKKLA